MPGSPWTWRIHGWLLLLDLAGFLLLLYIYILTCVVPAWGITPGHHASASFDVGFPRFSERGWVLIPFFLVYPKEFVRVLGQIQAYFEGRGILYYKYLFAPSVRERASSSENDPRDLIIYSHHGVYLPDNFSRAELAVLAELVKRGAGLSGG